ncbi:dithiobiotin synthetase [Escherichia coli]|uniref:Dithiobiotin synthetase n=1 Tax=Escherichia coli TaxID=562 RepID=A0A377A0R5_ECOLX|nr:dithiobiotin synthetase [Escherichia coli]
MLKRFFITGTDTSVGKTVVSRALLQALASQGKTVAGYKPVAKGSKRHPKGCVIKMPWCCRVFQPSNCLMKQLILSR